MGACGAKGEGGVDGERLEPGGLLRVRRAASRRGQMGGAASAAGKDGGRAR